MLRTCKKCGFQSGSVSVFMSHIRREHPWKTANNFKAKKLKKVKTKELTVRVALNNGSQKPQLSALELLSKFKEQRDLMITVCNMIEGVINQ